MKDYKFTMTVSAYDCTGCGSCVNVCPDKVQAITMTGFEAHEDEQKYFDYAVSLEDKEDVIEKFKLNSVKGSQFRQTLHLLHLIQQTRRVMVLHGLTHCSKMQQSLVMVCYLLREQSVTD